MTPGQVAALEEAMPVGICHMTHGPGTFVVTPPSFLVAELTMSASATGLRKVICTKQAERVCATDQHRDKPSLVVEAVRELVSKLCAAEEAQAPAAAPAAAADGVAAAAQ